MQEVQHFMREILTWRDTILSECPDSDTIAAASLKIFERIKKYKLKQDRYALDTLLSSIINDIHENHIMAGCEYKGKVYSMHETNPSNVLLDLDVNILRDWSNTKSGQYWISTGKPF